MKTISIIVNIDRDTDLRHTKTLIDCVQKRGGKVKICNDISVILGRTNLGCDYQEIFDDTDAIICLGGDGTFLKAARTANKNEIPVLGINLGNLGFLTEVDKKKIDEAVECLFSGQYSIEKRMMLEAAIIRDGKIIGRDIALNDIVISKGALSRIIHIKTYINDSFVDIFPGDGLIVSSPTGSTAYSLSAGGPIVEPDLNVIIVTPICPHILYSRSFITDGDRTVKAIVDEKYKYSAMVTADGQEGHEIKGGDVIEVKKSQHHVNLIRMNPKNFFSILRKKIYYRGEDLRKNEV
ncbi:MAG TPA: NAD(+)/NADH kinase [Clostridiaceae bacterium]|nr:NAD(+)/NADH kinase [Clostridiaceae bacterium]